MIKKISIFLRTIGKVTNWYILPLVYFGLYKKEFFTVSLKNGIKLKLRTKSTDIQAFTNVWILQEYDHGEVIVKNDDTIIDVGAHIGLFCTYVSQFCKEGKILCYEPVEENYKLLKENVEQNNLKNIFCYNIAVSNENKKLKIFLDYNDSAAHSIYGSGLHFIEIDAISLKEIIDSNNISRCDFLKLDCEGAEYEIIEALPDEYFKKIEKISLEYHNSVSEPNRIKNLKKRLNSLNYKLVDNPSINGMGILLAR